MKAFGQKVISDEQQQFFLREGDSGLSHNAGSLQPRQGHVCPDQQRFARDPLYQLRRKLAELDMFTAFVLEHRLLHELLNVSAAKQRQLADDLSDGGGAGQTHQSFAGQSSDLISISNWHLHSQKRKQNLKKDKSIHIVKKLQQDVNLNLKI